MQYPRSILGTAVIAAMATTHPLAHSAVTGSEASLSERGLEIRSPLKLDASRLMGMKAGDKVDIVFPVIGKRTIVFENTTKGLDGSRYWHGSLAGKPMDRVFLQQHREGFTGAVRFGSRQIAFQQRRDGSLARVATPAVVAKPAYTVGAMVSDGVYELQANFAAMTQAPEGGEITLPLPHGGVEVAIVTKTEIDRDGFVQVRGISRIGGLGSPTVMTIGKDAVFGSVHVNGREYQIVTRNGRQQLVDPQGAGWTEPNGHDEVEADWTDYFQRYVKSTKGTSGTTSGTSSGSSSLKPLPAGTVDTTLTLLMTYGTGYVAQWGSESIARARMSNLVQLANTAHANSGTGVNYRIVGWKKVSQANADIHDILPAMRDNNGAFTGLDTYKRSIGASTVVYMSPYNATNLGTCGTGYVPAAGGKGLAEYKTSAARLLFSVVNDGEIPAKDSYCSTATLTHELGHNLGNRHDKEHSDRPGVFSYSHGKGVDDVFGTVMSYIRPRILMFSSPHLTCSTSAPQPCGSSTENVVATILQTKSVVQALGDPDAGSASVDGYKVVAGWLFNGSGAPYTGAATVMATNPQITCSTGATGLYVCKVPNDLSTVTVKVSATGKSVSPSSGSFPVKAEANTPINGTSFRIN